jgi:hypothetical protein
MIALLVCTLASASQVGPVAAKTPAEAIAIVDARPNNGIKGVYEMKVVAAERRPNALYLNSSADYRSSDDVTFRLTPLAAKSLEKRLGAKPEVALIGKTVTVRGEIQNVPIANVIGGQQKSFNRYQHTVLIQDANQLSIQ